MEPIISGVVSYAVSKIDKYILTRLASKVTYVCFINRNFGKLKSEVEELKKTKECVQDEVSSAISNADDIKPVVEKWLSEVNDIISKYEEMVLLNEGRHGRSCSNLVQRHKLSKQASKMVDEVIQLNGKGSFDQVYSPGLLINLRPPQKIGFLDFESRVLTMNQIINALKGNHVSRIGVHGMGGVGKTMLVEEILRKIMEENVFDKVVKLTISQASDLKLIQNQLADMLDMKLEQETIEGRALKLQKRLVNEKSILIVLDDIWEQIDLEKIGIPSVEDHIGRKILLTSREKNVLSNDMDTNITFEIKVLELRESWNLFETIIGENFENKKSLAHQIVKECAHLPIAITTVAKTLRDKNSDIWENALSQLKNSVNVKIKGMDKKVYSSLKLSYDHLKYEEDKLLFLLCSMFPEDIYIPIEDLQVQAFAMGFLSGVETLAQGRLEITKLVDDLVSSSLLLQHEIKNKYFVKMHDLLRDVAISISSQNDKIHTLSYVGKGNENWEEKLSGNYTAVYVSIQDLHNTLIQKILIPKVQLLTLRGSYFAKYELVQSFFEEMKELKSLELVFVKIPIFPLSLHSFANVRLLHLCYCELGNIDMIGELKKLQILSFKGSKIIQIPTSLSQLTELKLLDLSHCCRLNVIPPNILSRLTKLEELYMETFDGWEREEWYKGRKNASLSELRCLPHLYALSLKISNIKIIPKQLFSREINLKRFHITIGGKLDERVGVNCSKLLSLNIKSECCLDDWISPLLKWSEELFIRGPFNMKTLPSELDENDSPQLKHLYFCDNLEIGHLIHEETKPLRKILSKLESLELKNMKNLESIVHGYDRESAFPKLRKVNVCNCYELKNLFFKCTLDDILNLEEIDISGCEKMEVIFVIEEEESTNQIEFTHLKSLSLQGGFPQLQKFCSKIRKPETSTICNDGSLIREEVSLPKLEKISISEAQNLKMICNNILFPDSFSKLKEVHIVSCHSLEKVFSWRIMSILSWLEHIWICDCNLLESIFEVQQSNITKGSVALLPQLKKLTLSRLSSLRYVWSEDPYELQVFENMETLSIKQCPKLRKECIIKVLPKLKIWETDLSGMEDILAKERSMGTSKLHHSNTSKVSLPKLEKISISYAQNLKMICNNILFPDSFSKLKEVHIVSCHSLEKVFSWRIMSNLSCLASILIHDCELLEGIFEAQEPNVTKGSAVLLPQLKNLRLSRLSSLRYIWSEDLYELQVFKNMETLSIEQCPKFSKECIIEVLPKLKIWETDLSGMEDILAKERSMGTSKLHHSNTSKVSFPKLVEISIKNAENLKMMCNDILFPDSFSKLKEVHIVSCNSLEKVFSWRIMSILFCLESIEISNCNLLEGIFEVQKSNVTKGSVALLPQLKKLTLSRLSSLRYVWSEDPYELQVFENMKTLSIEQCPKLRKECIIKVLPKLKIWETDLSGMEDILAKERSMGTSKLHHSNTSKVDTIQAQKDSDLFVELESWTLLGCLDYKLNQLPIAMVQMLPCIQVLEVRNALIEEIFPNDRLVSVKEHQCALRILYLLKLPKIKNLWKEGSHNNTLVLLQQLCYLSISECGILNTLVPSTASFRNLVTLYVRYCHRLIHLLNPSVARTLVRLQDLEIEGCKTMKTVIDVGVVEDENDKIIFNRLRWLRLSNIPELTSFHSGRCIIEFPWLSDVSISNCPEMKIFSFETVSTPLLKLENFQLVHDRAPAPLINPIAMFVEDINVNIRQGWECSSNTYISDLFTEENLEESESDYSTSYEEE